LFEIEENNKKNVNDILYVLKLASLLFCLLIIYNDFNFNYYLLIHSINTNYRATIIGIILLCIFLIYFLCSLSTKIFRKFQYRKYICYIENYFLICMISLLIILSGNNTCQYKFLFMFVVITATLQSGMKQGLLIACISSVAILLIDLTSSFSSGFSIFFENDFIIVGVFILTAWPLGHYVQMEEDNLNKKNLQLSELNNELINQNNRSKCIEEKLLKNEVCCSMIIKNSKDVILVHDDNKVLFANESATTLLGLSLNELSTKSIYDFISDKKKEYAKKIIEKELNGQETQGKFEVNLLDNNGNEITVEYISNCFLYEGKPAILSILHDISSEIQVKQLKQDMKKSVELLTETTEFNNSIIELFANISHELKTPLNVIFSAIQVLNIYKNDTEKLENKIDDYLALIRQNCYRLMRLINNFLDITKVDSGFLKLNIVNCNIVKIVEDISLSVASYAKSKNLDLIFDTDVEEKFIGFDPDKIERIMLNLLSNAIKYSKPTGQILVTLLDEGDTICISVKDTGLGIPADKGKLIFERFGQVDRTLKRVSEGSGIGLSLVKSFVEMHNGRIELKSELGEGSEFIITLPSTLMGYELEDKKTIHETNSERINIEFSDIYTK
jgi:PAS domain S-box-containing protein